MNTPFFQMPVTNPAPASSSNWDMNWNVNRYVNQPLAQNGYNFNTVAQPQLQAGGWHAPMAPGFTPAASTNTGSNWFTADNMNALGTGLNAVGSIMSGWGALQQVDVARDQLAFQKDSFNKQFENQRTLTNARLRDRQRARVGANPNGYQSVGDYMNENGV